MILRNNEESYAITVHRLIHATLLCLAGCDTINTVTSKQLKRTASAWRRPGV